MAKFRIVRYRYNNRYHKDSKADLFIVQRLFLFILWIRVKSFRSRYFVKDDTDYADGFVQAKEYIDYKKKCLKSIDKTIIEYI